jgi:hypothetical protein
MRTILPVAVILKRLAAPRCVFSFFLGFVEFLGITKSSPNNDASSLHLAELGRSTAAPLQ